MFTVAGSVLWSACSVTAVVCSVLAARRPRAVRAGRIAVGVLVLVGGALFNAVQLAQGDDYAGFADPSPFPWIARTWRAVVPPHHVLLIGLLVVFEAAVGLLVLDGGRGTRLGYGGAIAFHLLLWPFGWFELGYSLLMLPAPALLLRAERRGTAPAGPATGRRRTGRARVQDRGDGAAARRLRLGGPARVRRPGHRGGGTGVAGRRVPGCGSS